MDGSWRCTDDNKIEGSVMGRAKYKQALKQLVMLLASIALTRLSQGAWLGVMTLMGLTWALSGKVGKALSMYMMIICMVGINPILLPAGRFFGHFVRFGPLLIGLALMLKGVSMPGQSRVPLGMLMVYLGLAAISSMNGWAPIVSYLKIVNFLIFILGFWGGIHTLSYDSDGIKELRATFMAFAIFLILGSAALLPFPGISTLSGFQLALQEGNLEVANAAMKSLEGSTPLFCGVTKQSQFFAPLAGCMIAWLLADMLFVEQRFDKFHLAMMGIGVILTYWSGSRTGLLTLMVGVMMVAMYLPNKISLPFNIKRRLKAGVAAMLALGMVAAVASEIMNDSISQWLRKTDDVEEDTRSLSEAVTSSRQGLIEESMRDFRRNPVFGSGFQVAESTAELVARSGSGLVISAPIEKGVLPVMVLGETGIVGAVFFMMFLVAFYIGSSRRKLYVTLALFTVMLASNMGEATFFSPGGMGGLLWAICVIGGYCIDIMLANHWKMYFRNR